MREMTRMSLLEHPTAQALLADAEVSAADRGRLPPAPGGLPAALPAPLLPRRAARAGPRRPAGQAQRPAAQDLRADRRPGRPPPQAGAALRRRRRLGRRGRHGRAAPPRRRGAGRPRGRPGPRPQRLPQVGGRLLRRGPAVVRPAGQGRQLPGRRLPGLRRPPPARPWWTGGCTCPRSGPADPERRAQATCPRRCTFQERWRIGLDLLDRTAAGAAVRLGRRRRRVRPGCARSGPSCAGGGSGTCWTCRATRWSATWRRRRRRAGGDRRGGAWTRGPRPSRAARWRQGAAGGGAKGPKVVRVAEAWVQTKDEDGRVGPRERLVVIRTVDQASRRRGTR